MGCHFFGLYSKHGGDDEEGYCLYVKKWILRAIGPIVLAILLVRLDFGATLAALRKASLSPLIMAYMMFIPSLFLRTVRWRVLMEPQGIRLEFWEAFNIYALSIFFGTVTPGRLGELIKALYLRQKGNTFGVSFVSVFMDRLCDVVFLLIFGCLALLSITSSAFGDVAPVAWILFSVALGGALLWLITRGRGKDAVLWLLSMVSPFAYKDPIITEFRSFSRGFGGMDWGTLTGAFFLTTIAWGANYGAVYLFGCALGFDISFFSMACIAAVCALITLIPVSVLGVGTRDAALILMLGQYGISEAWAVAFSTLILSMLLFNGLICSFSLFGRAGKFRWRSVTGNH